VPPGVVKHKPSPARLVSARHALLLGALAIGVYWNSFPGTFLLDDFASIHQNASIRALSTSLRPPNQGQSVSGRPIANLSLALDYALDGLKPAVYHATNLLIHIACGIFVMALVRLAFSSPRLEALFDDHRQRDLVALACAAIWLVHPIQSEPVNYTIARTESLMALCCLATIYGSLRAALSGASRLAWQTLALAACAIGMACKESMAVAPLLVVIVDRALVFNSIAAALKQRFRFYAALASTLLVLGALMLGNPRASSAGFAIAAGTAADVTLGGYLLNQALVLPHYLELFVWPRDLVLDYGPIRALSFGAVAVPAIVIVLCAVAGLALWIWKPLAGLPLAWIAITLAPTTLVPIVTEIGADRRLYLASVVPIAALVLLAWKAGARRRHGLAIATAVVLVLSYLTMLRNAEYQTPYRMWSTVVERWPHGRAYQNLAVEADALGRRDEVLPLLRQAALDSPDARYPLGVRLYEVREYPEAIQNLESFLRERPGHYQGDAATQTLVRSWTDLGIVRAQAGDMAGAVEAFRSALRLDPANPGLQRNLESALIDAGARPPIRPQ
jgi:tetratricopeptide (TPR) repeat protein